MRTGLWQGEGMKWWWIVLGIIVLVNVFLLVELGLAWRAGRRRLKKGRREPNN